MKKFIILAILGLLSLNAHALTDSEVESRLYDSLEDLKSHATNKKYKTHEKNYDGSLVEIGKSWNIGEWDLERIDGAVIALSKSLTDFKAQKIKKNGIQSITDYIYKNPIYYRDVKGKTVIKWYLIPADRYIPNNSKTEFLLTDIQKHLEDKYGKKVFRKIVERDSSK